jgi:hypothetical protein
MTAAEDAASKVRQAARRARPFRIGSLVLVVVALGLRTGLIVALSTVVLVPVAIWAAVAGDHLRYTRGLANGALARAGAGMQIRGGRRWIGVLTVEPGGVRWTPSKRFRKRGADEVVVQWQTIADVTAARTSARWTNWMARTDVLAFEQTDGTCSTFTVTSPQDIYRALGDSGLSVEVAE